MATIKSIHRKYGERICRRCINAEYHVELVPEDCRYFLYLQRCSCCGDLHNVVTGFRMSGRRKLLFR